VTITITGTNDAPEVTHTANWLSSDPSEAPDSGYYALLVANPVDVDSLDQLVVTADAVPDGVYYFDGTNYIPVTTGMTLYVDGGVNLLGSLYYKPTSDMDDIQNLEFTLSVSDGSATVSQSVYIHEVIPMRTPGPVGTISSNKSPLNSGTDAQAQSILSGVFVDAVNASPEDGQLTLLTNFQDWNDKIFDPSVNGRYRINLDDRDGDDLEQQVNVYLIVGSVKFQVIEANDANPDNWLYDDSTGLMKTIVDFDDVINVADSSQSLADYLATTPVSSGDVWTIQYEDNTGGVQQARYVEFQYEVYDSGNPSIVVHGNDLIDQIYGTSGNDQLHGDNGDDIIIGGPGSDIMTGGAGSDTFKYTPDDLDGSLDQIADFELGASGDVLDLSAVLGGTGLMVQDLLDNGYLTITEVANTLNVKIDADGDGSTTTDIVDIDITVSGSPDPGDTALETMLAHDQIKIS
jgi:hypothetical protein